MSDTEQSADWVCHLLQVSDPLFPTGAYAHSMGLEQWAKTCNYRSSDDLVLFFQHHVGSALSRLELPYLRFVRKAIDAEDWTKIWELDNEVDSWKWASEIRAASVAQGRGRLRLLKKMWPDAEKLKRYILAFEQGEACGHHLVISALQFDVLKVPEQAGLLTYGYQTLANFVSASIKLLRISPEAAQKALHQGLQWLPEWVRKSKYVERETAGWFSPSFDIESARHATTFSRLFIS